MGETIDDSPNLQKKVVIGFFRFMAYLLLPVAGMRTEYKTIDFDYSFYLGKDYN